MIEVAKALSYNQLYSVRFIATYLQWLFHSGERAVAHGPLVLFVNIKNEM